MNNRKVAENWREQTGRMKNGSHMYYEGKTIYSYGSHFPMAYITGLNFGGREIILQNSDSYSNSTAKHLTHMRAQCYGDAIIEVPTHVLKDLIYEFENSEVRPGTLEQAVNEIQARINRNAIQKTRARTRKEMYQSQIDRDNEQLEVLNSL